MLEVSQCLKDWYIQTRFHAPDDGTEDMWQLLYPEHFVNVQFKRHHKKRKENEIVNVANVMRAGLMKHVDNSSPQLLISEKLPQLHDDNSVESIISEISGIFNPIQHKDGSSMEPKMILINGAPGIGKTKLCKEIAFRWGNGSLITNSSLVFLLFLRDPGMQKIYELKDLIHYFYGFDPSAANLSAHVAEIITKRDNNDITILLDGFDEFANTDKNLLVNKIINRKFLAQSKLIITSRPISSEKLQKVADVTVEVLGFTEESKMSFIEKELDSYQERSRLASILNICFDINSSCYFPIMMTILVCIFKHDEDLPNDEAELYEKFVILIISRFLKKLEMKASPPISDMHLKNLPQLYKDYLGNLSKLAYKFIKVNKIVFTKEDVESVCNNFNLDVDNYHGMGLLNYTEYTKCIGFKKCIYYNFLHLSIQEFLAAYYIDTLDMSDQFQSLKSTFFIDSYMQTWITFIQMNKFTICRFHQFETYSHTVGASNEAKSNVISMIKDLNLFEDLSRINGINISKIAGTFQFFCIKDPIQSLCEQETYFSSFDAFWFLKDMYRQSGAIKIYLSLCSVDDNVSHLMEVFFLDMYITRSAYHHMVEALQGNQNFAVVLISSNTLLAYRAKPHQISGALIMMNESLSAIFMRDCCITSDVANVVSLYLREHQMTKYVSITNWKKKIELQPLSLVIKALESRSNLISIDLDGNCLSETALCDLANVIKNNKSLQEVSLNDNNLQSSANVILLALKEISTLECLFLSSNSLSSQAAGNLLADVIQNNIDLMVLNLSFNNLQLSAKVMLKALSKVSRIRSLDLNQTNLTKSVANDLAAMIKDNTCLEVLYLSNNNLQSSAVAILRALKEISTLKKLNLCGNNMPKEVDQDLADVVTNNTSLEVLFLGNNNLQSCALLSALMQLTNLKIFDLSDNTLSSQAMQDLVNVINNNSYLEVFSLNNCNFQSSISIILQALKGLSNLKKLHLRHTNMPGDVVHELADVIKANPHLEDLDLSYNMKLQSYLVVIFQALFETPNLKVLNLSGNNMSEAVVDSLAGVIKNNPYLEELTLDNNVLRSSAKVIFHALREISSLRKLNLNSNKMTEDVACDLADVIKHNNCLEEIQLFNNFQSSSLVILNALQAVYNLKVLCLDVKGMSAIEISCLADVLRCNPFFENLELFNLQSSVSVILQALRGVSNLKVLILVNCNLLREAMDELSGVINSTTLEELHLCLCTQSAALVMIQALKTISSLKKLNLIGNNMSGTVVNDLADVIKSNVSLEEIYLGNNNLQSSAIVVLQALKRISTLKKLDLSNNNMSAKVVNDLADVIKNNCCLEVLNLLNNDLRSSVVMILQALQSSTCLKMLFLENNMLGKVANDLADAIKVNTSLHTLCLGFNGLRSFAAVVLQAMKKLTQLKILTLGNSVTSYIVNDLADVIRNNVYLEVLSLSCNHLQSSAAVILQALEELNNLKILDLANNRISGKALHSLSHVGRSNSLIWLEISGNNLQSDFTIKSHAGCQLQSLFINDTNLSITAVNSLLATVHHNHTISDIWLGDNNIQQGLLNIVKDCSVLPNLEVLELSHNNYDKSDVANLASHVVGIASLKSLMFGGITLCCKEYFCIRVLTFFNELQNFTAEENYSINELCEVVTLEMQNYLLSSSIKYSYSIKLRLSILTPSLLYCDVNISKIVYVMELWFKSITAALSAAKSSFQSLLQIESEVIISTLSDSIKRLVVLDLEYSNIGEDAALKLAEAIQCNNVLEQLWLRGNVLCDKGARLILDSLQSVKTLLALDISFNNISSKSSDGIVAVIKSNSSLEQLWLDGNCLQTSGVVRIADALESHCKLRLLSLSQNGITEDAGGVISSIVCSNISMQVLMLGQNNLQSSLICELSKANCCVGRLIKLDLFNNQVTKECAAELAGIIKNCTNLQELYLGKNMLETTGTLEILKALKTTCSLRILTLSNNKITKEAASSICKVIDVHFALNVLLLGGNELQSEGVRAIVEAVRYNEALQLLAVCDNSIDEQTKEDIKAILSSNPDLHLYI